MVKTILEAIYFAVVGMAVVGLISNFKSIAGVLCSSYIDGMAE